MWKTNKVWDGPKAQERGVRIEKNPNGVDVWVNNRHYSLFTADKNEIIEALGGVPKPAKAPKQSAAAKADQKAVVNAKHASDILDELTPTMTKKDLLAEVDKALDLLP